MEAKPGGEARRDGNRGKTGISDKIGVAEFTYGCRGRRKDTPIGIGSKKRGGD